MGKNPLYDFLVNNATALKNILCIVVDENGARIHNKMWKADHYIVVDKHKKPLPCFAFVNKHNILNPVTFAEVWKKVYGRKHD